MARGRDAGMACAGLDGGRTVLCGARYSCSLLGLASHRIHAMTPPITAANATAQPASSTRCAARLPRPWSLLAKDCRPGNGRAER